MENFGIEDDGQADAGQVDAGQADDGDEIDGEAMTPMPLEGEEQSRQDVDDASQKKKGTKKKGDSKPPDLSKLDEKSIKILAKLMLALMELELSLYDFFEGAVYEQLVKTKTKQNVVEIINSKDFYEFL
jgi:hypothetical protein